MDPYITGIDPLYAIGSNINLNKVRTKTDAKREFATIFVSQILKEVFKSQSSMFGEEGSLGVFSDNLYNDILLAKISGEIAGNKSFGFDKLMTGNK
jgi:Rod binding domain-containing protein